MTAQKQLLTTAGATTRKPGVVSSSPFAESKMGIKTVKYADNLVAMVFGSRVLLFNTEYLLGKHGTGTGSAGSKLGQVDSEEKLTNLLKQHVDESKLAECKGIMRLANIDSEQVVGSDGLVEILSLRKGEENIAVGSTLESDVDYRAVVKDAAGNEHEVRLRYEITRPGSPDGKFPVIMQPVAYTDVEAPNTNRLNIIIGQVDLNDERAAWLEPAALRAVLGEVIDKCEGVYAVFTIFPGTYAPAANEPISSQIDSVLGITGNEFWRNHALMKKQ